MRNERDKSEDDRFYKYVSWVLCFFTAFALIPFPVDAAAKTESDVIRVGWYEDSYHITGTNGERSGDGYEYEQSLASYTGWHYE